MYLSIRCNTIKSKEVSASSAYFWIDYIFIKSLQQHLLLKTLFAHTFLLYLYLLSFFQFYVWQSFRYLLLHSLFGVGTTFLTSEIFYLVLRRPGAPCSAIATTVVSTHAFFEKVNDKFTFSIFNSYNIYCFLSLTTLSKRFNPVNTWYRHASGYSASCTIDLNWVKPFVECVQFWIKLLAVKVRCSGTLGFEEKNLTKLMTIK